MTKSRATRVVALLLLVTLVTGFVAVSAAPDDGRVTGIWPVGLATAALLVARRRWPGDGRSGLIDDEVGRVDRGDEAQSGDAGEQRDGKTIHWLASNKQ